MQHLNINFSPDETPGGSSSIRPSVVDQGDVDESAQSEGSVAVSQDQIKALESRIDTLHSIVKSFVEGQRSVAATTQASSSSQTPLTEGQAGKDEPRSQTAGMEYLSRHGDGKMRYVNATHWAAMHHEVTELDEILSSQGGVGFVAQDSDYQEQLHGAERLATSPSLEEAPPPGSGALLRPPLGHRSSTQHTYGSVVSLWRHMPPKAQCDHFLRCYFRGCHPLVPLVHIPTFWKSYNAFWDASDVNYQQSGAALSFTALMFALLYQGASSDAGRKQHQNGLTQDQLNSRAIYLRNLTVKALRRSNFSRTPTLNTLRAYVIAQGTTFREEEPLANVAFVGMALRIANMLGLHRDPCHFSGLSLIEAEERRRTWWHVVHIDTMASIAAGLPFVIDDDTWDVQAISELDDRYIGTRIGVEYDASVKRGECVPQNASASIEPPGTWLVSTAGILAACKFRYTMSLRNILQKTAAGSLSSSTAEEAWHELQNLDQDIQASIQRVPDPVSHEGTEANPDSVLTELIGLNSWARLLMSTYIDQRYCIISRTLYIAVGDVTRPAVRQKSVQASMSCLVKMARLGANDQFEYFYWTWPGNHQPLHAVMILLNELLEKPATTSASRARSIVDVVFTLIGPGSGSVAGETSSHSSSTGSSNDGGGEVWRSLRRLRSKAWRAADLDPELTWSRSEALSVCNELYESMARPQQQRSAPLDVMDLGMELDETAGLPSNFWEGVSDTEMEFGLFSLPARDWSDLNLEGFEDL